MTLEKSFLRDLRALRKKYGFHQTSLSADETYLNLLRAVPTTQDHPLIMLHNVSTFKDLQPHLTAVYKHLNFNSFSFGPDCQFLPHEVVLKMISMWHTTGKIKERKGLFHICVSSENVKTIADLNVAILHQMIHLYVMMYHPTETSKHGKEFYKCAARMAKHYAIDALKTCKVL